MKKLFTLLLLLTALFSKAPQSSAQVIFSESFDSVKYFQRVPAGWTDSIFQYTFNSLEPEGYPTWYQSNLPGEPYYCYDYACNGCLYPVASNTCPTCTYSYYDPLPSNYGSTVAGPYGTVFGETDAEPAPSSHSGTNPNCGGDGYISYMAGENGYAAEDLYSYNTPSIVANYSAELGSPSIDLHTAYVANGGLGTIRLSFWLFTEYVPYYSPIQNQLKVYINTSPVSAGGTLIDSIYPFNDPNSGPEYSEQWTQYKYTLPTSYYTSNSVYIIFKGIVPTQTTQYQENGEDIDLDDIAVTYIPPCDSPTAQPSNMRFATSASIISDTFTAPVPAPSGYLIVRSIGPFIGYPVNSTTYNLGQSIGANGTIVALGNATNFRDSLLTPGTAYTYTAYAYSSGDVCSITYNRADPLIGTVTTGSTSTYTWNRVVQANFVAPTNWTPSRVVPDPTDILVFNNGISDTANGVPTQGIGNLSITNNTQAHLRATSDGIFTVNLNGVASAPGVQIAAGSGLILDGTASLTLAFGAGTRPNIAGNLEVESNSSTNQIDFTNAVTTIAASTGQLAAGGNNNNYPFIIPSASALTINGTYNNKYTSVGGFIVNPATWGPSSTVLISGYTTSTDGPDPGGLNQIFPNFIYDAPSQTSACNWAGNSLNITGTLNITSTGSGSWVLAGTQPYTTTVHNFVQAGGTLDLASGANATATTQVVNITGTFNQLGVSSVITSSGTGTTQPILYFNGNSGQQSVTLSNSPTGPIVYRIGNSAGINLLGVNALNSTPLLAINSGGGVRISTTTANPINTSLLLQYATANSTLTFDTTGSIVATAPVWPSATPPFNVVINVNTGNTVKVPFNATVAGALTFLSGDIDMSSYNLTVGNSTLATNQGSIIEPVGGAYVNVPGNGNVRLTTGSLTRWFGTAGLPTAALPPVALFAGSPSGTSSQGYFPISYGGSNRNITLYFSAVNALATGGTITISHNFATGTTALSPTVTDNTPPSYVMNVRTNASWTFSTGNLLSLNSGATFSINATAGNMVNPINATKLRLTHQTSDPGTNGGGGGLAPNFTATRTGLASTDLTGGAWYIGANTTDVNTGTNGVYTAITTGNWTSASNWDIGAVPGVNNVAVINPGVVTTINTASCTAKSLTVLGTINDNTSGNVLNIDSELINNGTISVNGGSLLLNSNGAANAVTQFSNVGIYNYGNFTINGGSVSIGPVNGGNKPFKNYGGLTVGPLATSKLTVNGYFSSLPGSYFTQSNGNITVDGNAGGVLANSTPPGFALFSLSTSTIHLNGGYTVIVDPHIDPSTNASFGLGTAFEYVVPDATVYNDSSAHTFFFGDSVSTDAGGTTGGFRIKPLSQTGLFNFSNLVVRGAAGVNRAVTAFPGEPLGVQNVLTINNGGEYQTANQNLVVNGNIKVNAGGKLTTDNAGTLIFGHLTLIGTTAGVLPATPPASAQPQTLSGAGIIVNSANTAANLGKVQVMSPPYVVFNTGTNLLFPSTDPLTLTPVNGVPSRIIMASGILGETAASGTSNNGSATNGWIIGGYQKHAAVGNIASANFTYPIGDSTNYTPVTLSGTGTDVSTAGNIAISTNPFYSPNLASSAFNPLQVLNRIYTITTPGLVLAPHAAVQAQFTWVPSDVPAGTDPQNFKMGVNPAGATWYYPHSTVNSQTTLNLDSLAPSGLAGVYQIGEGCPPTVITTQPLSNGFCLGAPASLSVVATGASLAYQWYHSNVAIPNANNATYSRQNSGLTDSGTYYVVITGACAAPDTSDKVVLTLGGKPPIIVQPKSTQVCAQSPATLNVVGPPNTTLYRWQKNDVDVPGTSAANAPSLTINNVTILDTGEYRVIIGNGCAFDTSFVVTLSLVPLPPVQITANTPLAFCQGTNVVLTANTGLGYTYQWKQNGTNISGATNAVYSATVAGNYSVAVSDVNSCTNVSAPDSITVFPSPPVTATNLGLTTFCVGGSVVLSANVDSSYTYNWQLNGANIPNAISSDYTASSSGNYSIKVTDAQNCSSTSPAILVTALTVPSGPIATSGPTALCTGNSVQLTAPAGVGYTYRWFDGSTEVTSNGNTISYTANTTGSYYAIVSNGYCVDTTAPVSVTLNPLPANTLSESSTTTFCQGGSVMLSAGTGSGLAYQWQNNGNNIQATDATYLATTTGNYRVVITNSANCTETTAPVSVTVNPLPLPDVTGSGDILSTEASFASYQWYKDGNPVPANGNSYMYTTTTSGIYTVYVIGNNGCGNMSAPFNHNAEGVNSVTAEHVRVYPNPARDIVYIDAPFTVNVSVNSLDGKELFNKPNAKNINISELANGIYMIRISDADGNLVSVEKLVKADN